MIRSTTLERLLKLEIESGSAENVRRYMELLAAQTSVEYADKALNFIIDDETLRLDKEDYDYEQRQRQQ